MRAPILLSAACAAGAWLPRAYAMPLNEFITTVNDTVQEILDEPMKPDPCKMKGSSFAAAPSIVKCLKSLPMVEEIRV